MAPYDATALLDQLETLVKQPSLEGFADENTRQRLREAARKFSIVLETPGDVIHRIANTPLQLAMARIGVEKKVFETLAKSSTPLTHTALASTTGIDPALMSRLVRYWQSFEMISELSEDQFSANNATKALAAPSGNAGINYFFETISGCFMQFPRWLRENGYKDPTDPSNVPWQLSHDSDLPMNWFMKNPQHFEYFIGWMMAQREGLPSWLDKFPFETLTKGATAETPVFVDVGGGAGHQCMALKQAHPNIVGRVILEDLAPSLERALPVPGMEKVAIDFWKGQPIQGARAYYLRNILHDWTDAQCLQILKGIVAAMSKESVILIDEMVLPNSRANWRATQLDMAMLTCLAARERTEKQWYALIDAAGLKIEKIYQYTEEIQDSIIVVVPR